MRAPGRFHRPRENAGNRPTTDIWYCSGASGLHRVEEDSHLWLDAAEAGPARSRTLLFNVRRSPVSRNSPTEGEMEARGIAHALEVEIRRRMGNPTTISAPLDSHSAHVATQ